MIDTHAHLNDLKLYENRKAIIDNAKSVGVDTIFCVGYDFLSSKKASDISNEFENVYAVCGVHPEEAKEYNGRIEKKLSGLFSNKKVVAVGEIGLDYFYELLDKEKQKEVFIKQILLADKFNLPIVIHTREAMQDTIKILTDYKQNIRNGGILHCFNGTTDEANQILNLGLYVAFGGQITFKNNNALCEVVKSVPLSKIVLETDSPYLSPKRGEVNEPKNIPIICQKIADLKGITFEEAQKITSENARRVYKI